MSDQRQDWAALHRDLVSRLGFGDNITEPMADNDTIVKWFEEQGREASEWRESQRWRDECYAKGHSDDDDCFECDPRLRLGRAEKQLTDARQAILVLLDDLADEKRRHAGLQENRISLANQLTHAENVSDRLVQAIRDLYLNQYTHQGDCANADGSGRACDCWRSEFGVDLMATIDRALLSDTTTGGPQPTDGPDYHADHQAWTDAATPHQTPRIGTEKYRGKS